MRVGTLLAAVLVLVGFALPGAAQEKLPVKVTVSPPSVTPGQKVKVTVQTVKDAVCTIVIRFRVGPLTGPSRQANDAGEVSWEVPTAGRVQQNAPIEVNCALGDRKGWGAAALSIM